MSVFSNLTDKLKGGESEEDAEETEKDVEEKHPDHDSEEEEEICQFC